MIDLIINGNTISFTEEEWQFIKKEIIEDTLQFQAATFKEFGEFAKDLADESFDPGNSISSFKKHKSALEKLKSVGINIFELNKI